MLAWKGGKSRAKVLAHVTIGLSGVLALWILGKPQPADPRWLFVSRSDLVLNSPSSLSSFSTFSGSNVLSALS